MKFIESETLELKKSTFKRKSYTEGAELSGAKGGGSKEKSKEKILRLMAENSAITINEIAEILGMSLAGVEKSIRILKQQERLRRVGPAKGGHWEIVGG